MLQLVNLSNYECDMDIINHSAECLQTFLQHHHLDGIEMMIGDTWDCQVHKKEWIQGVHLHCWFNWLDFWRNNQRELLKQFSSEEEMRDCYGGVTRHEWLNVQRKHIQTATQTGAKYLVFHVCQVRTDEMFNRQFRATDREVIEAAVEVINELVDGIPDDMEILFENLWWVGLTLTDKSLTGLLLEKVKHPRVGIMLDTGHLMNVNQELKTEEEGIQYILKVVENLGEYKQYIHGIHLHHSLSGHYSKSCKDSLPSERTTAELMEHVLKIDQHRPFGVPAVQRIIESVKPNYLVHEFLYISMEDWSEKINIQQQALAMKGDSR